MYATMADGAAQQAARRAWQAQQAAGPSESLGLPALVAHVCAEAGVWAPDAAELALRQSRGELAGAVSLVRVWAATLPHLPALPVDPEQVLVIRRITSAFDDLPDGQWLGLAPEMAGRILDWDAAAAAENTSQPAERNDSAASDLAEPPQPWDHAEIGHRSPPRLSGLSKVRALLGEARVADGNDQQAGLDPASEPVRPPYCRATRLGLLARAESGAMVALASAVMARRREAILTELISAQVPVTVPHPRTGKPVRVTEVPVVSAEVAIDSEIDQRHGLVLGWAATLGGLQRRALSAALLDAACNDPQPVTTIELDAENISTLTEASATNGFVDHLVLPHCASFASYLTNATMEGTE